MFIRKNLNSKWLTNFPMKYFKIKMKLDQNNIQITKNPIFTKVTILKGGEINLKNKTFIFDTESSLKNILSDIESEFDTSFIIDADLHNSLQKQITISPLESPETSEGGKYSCYIEEILGIAKRLNLEDQDLHKFIGRIFAKNESDIKNHTHLRILHFSIVNELERLEKIKTRADKTASFRVTLLLLFLLAVLIIQTGWFYHMIYNVDYLGWDLVEPATYLISSIIFILGVFSYAKMHRNAISGEKLFSEMTRSIMTKRYIKTNFNTESYVGLKNQLDLVNRLIKESKRI